MAAHSAAAVDAKTTAQASTPATVPASPQSPVTAGQTGTVAKPTQASDDARWRPVLGLPCQLAVDLPVPEFRISDLLKLRTGSLVDVRWRVGHDLPLRLNGTLIGWSKIEVVGNRLAVRLTELA